MAYRISLLLLVLMPLYPVLAQRQSDTKISGVVQTQDGKPLPGATVRVKGTAVSTAADGFGRFSISAKPGDTLLVFTIGFAPLEKLCTPQPLLRLVMREEEQALDQVVVVGYGDERRRNITGSIASISHKEITKSSALSFDNAIVGKVAGVDVLSSSGQPGSATAITIRGISTLNPDGSQPLIVIDGIPVYGSGRDMNASTFTPSTTPASGFGGTTVADNLQTRNDFENNPLAHLNPNDIESIEVLKDAYATAIYGSRGAAGVILITTRKGTRATPSFQVRYVTGAAKPVGNHALLSGAEYGALYTEYYRQLGRGETFAADHATDWVEEVMRTAFTQQIDLSMAAGSDKMQYYLSGSYRSQPAYIINNDYERYTGRMNLTYNASDAFTVGSNVSVSHTDNTALNAASIYRQAILKAPNVPVIDENGQYVYGRGSNPIGNMDSNPVADAVLNTNALENVQTLGSLYAQYRPVKWLTFRSEFGTELTGSTAFTRRVKRPSGFGDDAVESTAQNRKVVMNNTVNVLYGGNSRHYINAVLGQSFERSTENSRTIGGYGFFSDEINNIGAAANRYISRTRKQSWALVSYFSRINYEHDNKYLAGITYRVDGSSKFSRNRRYVGFPSFSLGWRLSEESFLNGYTWIDDLKLRGSIGFSGNNSPFSYYGSQGQYRINSNGLTYAGTPILEMQQPDNPNLKWERTMSIDVGIDATFWNNRLSVTLDYYERRIRNMIITSAIPLYQGWAFQPQNMGDMLNSGVELTVEGHPVRKADFNWAVRFNASHNANKLLRLNFDGEEVGLANDAYKYLKVGEPISQFFLYDWAGVDPYTGDPLWRDHSGNVSHVPPASLFAQVDDVNDFRKVYGTSLPLFWGGMGNTLRYKSWELDVFFSFSVGGKMINGSRATLLTYATDDANNLSREILNYWKITGDETDVPRLANRSITTSPGSASSVRDFTTGRTNSRFLEDASYLRMRTVNVGYQLPAAVLQRVPGQAVRSLQLFLRGTNLFTLTGYSGVDPEVNAFGSSALQSGYDELNMPQNKLVELGINIGL
ncbi:SusC/RagA family TonB-linked outer membrane protein [Parapedobacter deserti]|uniref:SusC/RagA family TonB-linked outer membrane protein n=1 Tax=Parapedobacter deserti TaxID=1912957 RepID=A0ABV7JK35_9SPHI